MHFLKQTLYFLCSSAVLWSCTSFIALQKSGNATLHRQAGHWTVHFHFLYLSNCDIIIHIYAEIKYFSIEPVRTIDYYAINTTN